MVENVFNQSIWGDEGFSAILSMKPLPEIIKIISKDTSPPLWNLTEWLVFKTLGTDEIYIRGLSLFFFFGAAIFTYKIGSFYWSRKTGFWALILTILNPFFFIYAFEGRMYSIMALGVTASNYFFLRIFYNEEKVRQRDKIGYFFFTLWALYSHHFAIFNIFIQILWWFYELIFGKRNRAKKMFKLFLITGLGYTPWLIPLYNQTKMVSGGFWLGKPNSNDLINLIFDYLACGIKNTNLKIPILNKPLYEIGLYLVFATLILRKWWKNFKKTLFQILCFLGPIILTWLISQNFQSIFFNRYLLYTIPSAMIILASSRSKISIVPLSTLVILFGIIDYNYFTHPQKLPFRQYSEYVKSQLKEGDFLINWNSSSHHLWETKYYGIPAPIYIPPHGGELPFFVGTALMEKEDIIREIPKDIKRLGVITSGPIEEIVLTDYTQISLKEFKNLKFILYEKSK